MNITHMYRIYDTRTKTYHHQSRQWNVWLDQNDAQAALSKLNMRVFATYVIQRFRLRRVENVSQRLPESQGRLYFLRNSDGTLNEPEKSIENGNTCWYSYKQACKIAKKRNCTVEIYAYTLLDRKQLIKNILESDEA